MSRYFITHIVPKDMISRCKIPSAACYFSYNLMEGGTFDKTICIPPSNISGKSSLYKDRAYTLMYSNFRNVKLLRKLAPFFENIMAFRKINNGAHVWFYNVTIISVFLIILLRLFKHKVKIYTIVLDFNPYEKRNRFLLYFINNSDGIINLSCSKIFTVQNCCTLPGVVPNHSEEPQIEIPLKRRFLLSGNLSLPISMMQIVLPAFAKMPDFELHISGFNGDEEVINEYANKYSNIFWHGVMEYEDFTKLMHECPFVLSMRDSNYPENFCNFPSKIIESLLHNRIVISTMHYEQLGVIKYLEIPSDTDGIVDYMIHLNNMKDEDLMCYANQSHIVQELFSNKVWNKRMSEIENKNITI